VVICHGLGEHCGRYGLLAGALAGRGLAVFTYDQRGHGHSEGARGHTPSFADLTDDLSRAFRKAEQEIPGDLPTGLIGHSMGGLVGLHYLLHDGSTKPTCAVISAPWLAVARPLLTLTLAVARMVGWVWPSAPFFNPRTDPSNLTRDPVMAQAWLDDDLIHRRITPAMFFAVQEAQREVVAFHGDVGTPLFLLIPTADPVVDARLNESWAQALEGDVRVDRLVGLRHEPFNEIERDEIFQEVGAWLKAHLSPE